MSEAYMGAISSHCPNAQLVLDRFHIVKALNDAIDDVRKEQWREASAADRKALKGLRWLLVPAFIHSFAPGHADSQGAGETQPENLSCVATQRRVRTTVDLQRPVGGTAILQAMDDLRLT